MTIVGADAEQLRATATKFTQAADRLQGSLKSLTSFVSNAGFWRGPDSERFRSEWNGQSVHSINAAVQALREGAEVLRRNADEQENASRPDGGSSGGGTAGGSSRPKYPQSAGGLHDMWNEINSIPKTDNSSGYRVQKVVGSDGVERYIVYIVGTAGSKTQTFGSNLQAISGVPDANQLRALERLIPEGAEVMLVGHSQGGMDAQNIAANSRLNVQQIVTTGSPVRNDLNIPAIHLQYAQDIVPSSAALNPALYSNSAQQKNDNVDVFSANTLPSSPFGLGDHFFGYGDLAEKWDNDVQKNPGGRAANAAANLSKFQGDVVDHVDIDKDGKGSW